MPFSVVSALSIFVRKLLHLLSMIGGICPFLGSFLLLLGRAGWVGVGWVGVGWVGVGWVGIGWVGIGWVGR